LESSEAAEQWCIDWIVKTVDALDLPDKFLLAGHSYGGWIASVYASHRPERVEQLFLISPAGLEAYNEKTYDPFSLRDI
jgi:cardiolipin-specific phospholipase